MLYTLARIHRESLQKDAGSAMECEKCGADVPESADACPECGEPIAPAADEAVVEASAEPAVEPAPDAESSAAPEPVTGEDAPGAISRKAATVALVALLAIAAVVGVVFFVPFGGSTVISRLTETNDPKSVAERMLAAYSKYDAKGILETTNSSALPAETRAQFESEAGKAKTRAGGKDAVKNVKVVGVTIDAKDKTKATVEISGEWLTDPAKGTYEARTDKLPMMQVGGKWVVQLF